MAYDRAFGEWVREHLAALGPIELKPMFGAAVAKVGDHTFAVLDDGMIWLKADEALAAELEAEGSRQFTFQSKDGETMRMAYWSLPEAAFDDPDAAAAWARRALEAALRKPVRKKKR